MWPFTKQSCVAPETNAQVAARDQRETLQLNTELVLMVRQGAVEIEEAPVVTDMSAAVMIRHVWQMAGRASIATEKYTRFVFNPLFVSCTENTNSFFFRGRV